MPTGHVKVFNADRNFGFITVEDGSEAYVSGDDLGGIALRTGDEVEFELADVEKGRKRATGISVTKQAPADNPVGRTMAPPPSWDQLEEQERQRRMARRRRR
ncbi:MAG: cold shock domain-containing protein [Nitriliruptoraceae bacterium]|nr:cold shock domain-containing protein [Nitriliruptoraceae bacterium]